MSWTDSIQSDLIIKTGDGNSYKPLWKNSCAKEIEYNIAQFDFPKVQGSLINRGTPMARKFSLEIYFQGDDNILTALNFEISARDSRPWNISHPIYGSILVQPTSLKFDYSGFNITQITGTVIETLGSAGLRITIDPSDKIRADKAAYDQQVSSSFAETNAILRARQRTAQQTTALTKINQKLYDIGVKAVKVTEDAGEYLNAFNIAQSSINQGISQASSIMTNLQAVINFPGQMINTLKVRIGVLASQFESLGANIGFITKQTDKVNYEATAGTLVAVACTNSITNIIPTNTTPTGTPAEYGTRNDVLDVITSIQEMYDTYKENLDSIQTDNGGLEDSYIPDDDSSKMLDDLVNYTISNLYIIALSAKQERIIILEEDSNVIILAHRFYGLQVDDSTITTFMDNNKIFLNEILQIKKGRELVFYI